jgi:Transposase
VGPPGARFTRDFEAVVAYLAQRTDKTTITRLRRCSWEAVAAITVPVVATYLDDARLEGRDRIGIDEVSYRKGYRYLTVVADHDRAGAVVWAGAGMSSATLERFFDILGPAAPPGWSRPRWTCTAPTPRSPAPAPPRPGVRRPLPHHPSWQRRRGRGPPGGLEHTRRAAGVTRPGPMPVSAKTRRAAGQEHPLGAAQRPGQLDRPAAPDIIQLRRARHVLFRAWS